MAYKFKTRIANGSNFGGTRSLSKIKYIVIHYTANDGDTDEANGKYFANNVVKASAHYFVDSDSVTQSVPDGYVAYSVGGSKYPDCSKTGGGKYYGIVNNTNSISIELCDDVRNGVVYPSEKTIKNAIELTKKLMKKYDIPVSRVIRHFDVNGKKCPAYWCGSEAKDKKWKAFKALLSDGAPAPAKDDDLEVDGKWGKATTKKLQKVLGTTQDGIVSGQKKKHKKYLQNCNETSWRFVDKPKGSNVIKALQRKVGVKANGYCSKATVKALQKFLGVKADGYCGAVTVKALQKWLNKK